MITFNLDYLDYFLGVVRKYMQLRGNLTQKDLSELTEIGISTMSRFLNQKTKDVDGQMVAKIVAKLDIPLHEVIDFIHEDSTAKFKKLVSFFRDAQDSAAGVTQPESITKTEATVTIGGVKRTIPFGEEQGAQTNNNHNSLDPSIVESLKSLTPRQKAYVKDFLSLDVEGRDLIVDIGNSLLSYFKQRGVEF
jgi:DNA-binding Xre family transcriptional regulator